MAKLYNAGHAYLSIMPSFKGVEKLMQRETKRLAQEIDKAVGQGAKDGLLRAFRDIDTDQIGRGARSAGDKWASQFERQVSRGLKEMADSLPSFTPDADMDDFDKAIAKTKKDLAELAKAKITPGQGGTGGLDAVGRKLDEITGRMTELSDAAEEADRKLQLRNFARQAELLSGLVDEAREQGREQGRTYGGEFAEQAGQRIAKALRQIPEVNVDADTTPADRELAELREQLVKLGDKKIGIDVDREQFGRDLDQITSRLESLARRRHTVGLEFDLSTAAAGLRDFHSKIAPILDRQLAEIGRSNGQSWAGAYADAVADRVQRAAQALPNIPFNIDDSQAQRTLAAIRQQLVNLSGKRVGVDIDAGTAEAQLTFLREQLEALDRDDVSVDVRTNAAAAAAQIAQIRQDTDSAGASMRGFSDQVGITMSRLGYMIAIGASIGSLIAPAAATAAVAIAGMGTAAAGVFAGLGVLALGLSGVGEAVKKIDAYQKDADKSAASFATAQNRVISATEAVRDAEQNLSYARQDAADAAVQAQERIEDAQRAVAKAQRDSAEAVARARRNEREAVEDVARARADAADMVARAIESQEDAERSLERAVKDQREARQELNEALRDAVRDLRELDTAVKRNALSISEATTASMKAKQEYDKLISNPRATEIERRMAYEAWQDKVIQIEELKNRGEELRKKQLAAAKEGVESTDRVKRAREQVANADERAADAARRLDNARRAVDRARVDAIEKVQKAEQRVADAHAATAKAQRDGAERVADAQRAVADAQRDAARQQQQAQRQILNATEAVTRAQRNLGQASTAAGQAGGEALDNMNDALSRLSPAGRKFAQWLYSLKPRLDELRATAQEGLLPGLQDSIQTLIDHYFPSFVRFVGKMAEGLGAMFRATSEILTTNPQWRAFFSFLADRALPSLEGMWVASLNVARGVANIVRALTPLSMPIGEGLVDLTERFARWSDQLQTDRGFQQFMEYTARVGPKVVALIEQMATFIGRLVIAAAPIGEIVLDAVTAVFQFINSWDLDTLTGVIAAVAVLGTGIWALAGFVRTIKFVTEAWTAVSVIATRAQGLLGAAITRYQVATVGATTSTGLLNGALFRTGGAAAAGAGGLRAMSAAAGPIGVALLVISAAWLSLEKAQSRAEEATDELGGSLKQLGDEYRKASVNATLGSTAVVDSFKRIAAQNGDMQRAVITLTQLGLSLDDIAAAAGGSAGQLDRVLGVINTRIAQLKAEMERLQELPDEGGMDLSAMDDDIRRLEKMRDRFTETAAQAHVTEDAMKILDAQTRAHTDSVARLTPQERALAEAQAVLADSASTAEDKMKALTNAQDVIRDSAIEANEANENWNSTLVSFREQVNAAKAANDRHASSLSLHTGQGLRNRDMLQQLIQSANRMYDADVALNGVTQKAIDKGNGHIDQIRRLARELGLNKKQTQVLIDTYRKIPTDIKTAVSMDPNSFNRVYNNLRRMLFMQDAAKRGLSPKDAEREWNVREAKREAGIRKGGAQFAEGGPIGGVGGPTEDANLIWASKGEFMQPADTVDYYGPEFMEAIRRRRIPKDAIPGFATGGQIGRPRWTWPIKYKVPDLDIPTDEEIFARAGALGGAAGGRGWRWQMNVLRKRFPGLPLYSGYRPGARTTSGNRSWHGIDGGRAVDVPPRQAVFNWIHDTYGQGTKELIWGGDPNRNIQRGKHHRYDDGLLRAHGPYKGRAGPSPHVHWAYDQGGMLPPGVSTVINETGKPEPVLTESQWQAISSLAHGAAGGAGNTYNFEFRDTTLDASKLRALQDREAALARTGRPR